MEVEINWLAVLAASLVGFIIGAIWYGPLFGKAWMKIVGLTEKDSANAYMGKIYAMCFVLQLIMPTNLAMFLGPESTLVTVTLYGFLIGFG